MLSEKVLIIKAIKALLWHNAGKCLPFLKTMYEENTMVQQEYDAGRIFWLGRGKRISCVRGKLWLTRPGSGDMIINSGESVTIEKKTLCEVLCGTALVDGLLPGERRDPVANAIISGKTLPLQEI